MLNIQPKIQNNVNLKSAKNQIHFGNSATVGRNTIYLATGREVKEPVFNFVLSALEDLSKMGIRGKNAIVEFVVKCKNSEYKLSKAAINTLEEAKLVDARGNLSESIKLEKNTAEEIKEIGLAIGGKQENSSFKLVDPKTGLPVEGFTTRPNINYSVMDLFG